MSKGFKLICKSKIQNLTAEVHTLGRMRKLTWKKYFFDYLIISTHKFLQINQDNNKIEYSSLDVR